MDNTTNGLVIYALAFIIFALAMVYLEWHKEG